MMLEHFNERVRQRLIAIGSETVFACIALSPCLSS
jgi:hypothetical protein